jgi:hypothetical protein
MKYAVQVFKVTLATSAALAAGCAAVDTKTIVAGADSYLAGNFTSAQLKPAVRAMVEKGDNLPKLFDRIDYAVTVDLDEEGKTSQVTSKNSLINLGNGYVQQKVEYSRNGLPYRINLALTFAGIYRLKTQATFVDRPNAQQPVETKEMSRFDRGLGTPQPGQTYSIDSKTGSEPQLANFLDEKHSCVAGAAIAASTVHQSLTGNGVPVECTMTGQSGAIVGRTKYVWVASLGVGFQTEYTSSRTTTRYKYETMTIRK